MKTTSSLLLTLLLILSGCTLFDFNSSSGSSPEIDVDFQLEEGESASLPGYNATLTFVDKTSDSRCPVDVVCVWEGEATVLLSLSTHLQSPDTFSISTWRSKSDQSQDEDGYPVKDTLGFRFTLLDVSPYPDTRIPEPGPTVIKLRVERP